LRSHPGLTFSSSDLGFAARIEAAEAANGIAMAESVRDLIPESACRAFAGGVAIFAGPNSPMTHALGIGMLRAVPNEELVAMEQFFFDRSCDCSVDLCPLADPSVLAFFQNRPYRVSEFNNVLVRQITPEDDFSPNRRARLAHIEEMQEWGRLVNRGFAEIMPPTDATAELLATTCSTARCWFVDDELEPAGGGAMAIKEGVAMFLGDAVLASSRRKGLHCELIRARLAEAQKQDVRLAMVSVLPGSTSHRNYERLGFQLVYMRVNLVRQFNRAD